MSELLARAALFSAIEGGHTFWSREIYSNSALYVYEKLLNNGYDRIKYEKLIAEIKLHTGEQVLERIAQHAVRFVTPLDVDWPIQVNMLKRGAVTQNIFIHNPEQISVIAPTLYSDAADRKTLWSKSILNPHQVFISLKIIILCKSISVFALVRILLCQKLYSWIYRILKFKNKTADSSIKITY